jgi:pimeloyl-ACP methyl ester carboxylesterase
MNQAEEITLDTPLGRLAGLHWKNPGAPPVLCLHGWLDNAASFLPLAGLLEGLDIVALDLPGHGHSEHRHHTARYHFIDYLWDVDAALNALGWERCHLLGHSMGGAVGSLYSAASPHHVRSLVVLEGLGPVTCPPENTASRMRKSMTKMRREQNPLKSYASIEEMVAARLRVSDLPEEAARLLCERSARWAGTHFEWRTDPALNWVSPILLTEEQVRNCLASIEVPLMSWVAEPVTRWHRRAAARERATPHGRHERIEGGHHFHMEIPGKIAAQVRSFILDHHQAG